MDPIFSLKTRREFLRTTLLGSALSWTVPSFLANTFAALEADAADRATQTPTGHDSPILVVLQMAGGNDGINTVVPYANDDYRRARPRLALPADSLLKLSDTVALHPSLAGFQALHDAGNLTIIQGTGYPNPNRSHFRSTEIWQTASESTQVEKYGWLGRYFDNCCAGSDPTIGVAIGQQMPQAFAAKRPTGISLLNPQSYRMGSGNYQSSRTDAVDRSLRAMNAPGLDLENLEMDNSGATIGSLTAPAHLTGSVLDYVERVALDAEISAEEIHRITKQVNNQATYPASPLANELKLVARLIAGGLPTRIYYVSQGGYDTHTNQLGTQARLLRMLGDSVKAFVDDLKAQGNFDRVLLMTFSEFGRRVSENANGGTDHGAAAPMFVIGSKVQAGVRGTYPSLAPDNLFNGDLKFTVDFRSVYAAILEHWLGTSSQPILRRKFQPFPLLKV